MGSFVRVLDTRWTFELISYASCRFGNATDIFSVCFPRKPDGKTFSVQIGAAMFFRIFFAETGREMLSVSANFGAEKVFSVDFGAENDFSVFFPQKRDGKQLYFPPSFRIRFKCSETTQIHKNANINAITTICNLNLELNMLFKAQQDFIYTW